MKNGKLLDDLTRACLFSRGINQQQSDYLRHLPTEQDKAWSVYPNHIFWNSKYAILRVTQSKNGPDFPVGVGSIGLMKQSLAKKERQGLVGVVVLARRGIGNSDLTYVDERSFAEVAAMLEKEEPREGNEGLADYWFVTGTFDVSERDDEF